MGELAVEVGTEAGAVVARWHGKSQAMDPSSVLAPTFADVIAKASAEGLPVIHDFCQLEFFNSATSTAVLHFIRRARSERRTVVLNYHGGLRWQRYCFDALAAFEKDDGLVRIRPLELPAPQRA